MKNDYREHIASTDQHQVWLHRTSKDLVDRIMKEGLTFLDLSGTATLQPSDIEKAENVYRTDFGTRKAVVVIKIPQEIAKKYYIQSPDTKGQRHEGYSGDKEVSYWHPNGKYAIQRQHVHGWIDKETDEYHENPYRNGPQQLTDKHFPSILYGGLEKSLEGPPKQTTKSRSKKEKELSRGELPPPPTEINILP